MIVETKDLQKIAMQLMAKGFCPICGYPVKSHSKIKSKVCCDILRTRLKVKSYVEKDGKIYEMNLRDARPEEM